MREITVVHDDFLPITFVFLILELDWHRLESYVLLRVLHDLVKPPLAIRTLIRELRPVKNTAKAKNMDTTL